MKVLENINTIGDAMNNLAAEENDKLRLCVYCRTEKPEKKFSLEHVIPQCLGGAYAPDNLKTRDVCQRCNGVLGLYVDAAFEKSWFITTKLQQNAVAFFDPQQEEGLPLTCFAICTTHNPPAMPDGYICELWSGPLGEQVYWIRPDDRRLFWYAGGNPVTAKQVDSWAYFLFSQRSILNPRITWNSFRDSFSRRRVKKIMCTMVDGADPATIGFSEPDDIDQQRIQYFLDHSNDTIKNRIPHHVHFEFRFLAKLAIGVSYCLFGKKALETDYSRQLHSALWHNIDDDESEWPEINGAGFAHATDSAFHQLMGFPNAITVGISVNSHGIALNLNISQESNFSIKCASLENLEPDDYRDIKDGIIIVLFKPLKQGFAFPLTDYVAHKLNKRILPDLAAIEELAEKRKDYFANLKSEISD